jgi:hypothetical protein
MLAHRHLRLFVASEVVTKLEQLADGTLWQYFPKAFCPEYSFCILFSFPPYTHLNIGTPELTRYLIMAINYYSQVTRVNNH